MEGLKNEQVKLMLYFDEAHVLAENKIPKDPDRKDTYDVVLQLLPVFAYIRIASQIRSSPRKCRCAALKRPLQKHPSIVHLAFPIIAGKLGLEDVCKVEFMAQFGRPIFWSLPASTGDHKEEICSTIVDLARAKSIRQHNISVKYTDLTPATVREAELVTSHMRIAFSVPKDREYFRSGYPSEPLLAEAVARQMENLSSDNNISLMANILKSEFCSGLVDQGQRGEVVFRQLVSEGCRHAVKKDHPHDSPHNFSKGCKLTTFIKKLFSEDYAEQVLNRVLDNFKSPTTFETVFKDVVVRFTHFGTTLQRLQMLYSLHSADTRPYVTLIATVGVQPSISPAATSARIVKDKIQKSPNPSKRPVTDNPTMADLHIPAQASDRCTSSLQRLCLPLFR
ncbi:hypothetical protein PILCRDRAFT_324 [Piloderma croceum F 1598]|uniref:Uncharacterized protein n=1 Tax=Piloderma croceum (strain F 1598) TaxID=765440 RepID=A0A0C3GNW9_PILCF|nr:hypothetical protein PILCRDRAFT_324 [Piloderma croceum F 1598]